MKFQNGSGPAARRGPAAQAGPSRWNLVALRRARNSPLKPGVRPGFQSKQTKRKDRPFGRSFQRVARPAGRAFAFILVDSGQKTGIKRGFRHLRMATQGSALRTRSLSRKAGESFISPSTHFIRAQRGNKDSDLRAGRDWYGAFFSHIQENHTDNCHTDTHGHGIEHRFERIDLFTKLRGDDTDDNEGSQIRRGQALTS